MTAKAKVYNGFMKPVYRFLGYAKKEPHILLTYFLILAIALFLRFSVGFRFGTIQYDEGAHSVGGIFVSRFFLYSSGETASYVAEYPATIDSLWFYPPLYSLFASISFSVLGYTELAARLVSLFFSVLLIHATVCVAREIEPDERVALIASFFVATSSIIVIVGSGAMVDVPLITLMMYSLLFWIKGIKSHTNNEFLKAGFFGGLSGLIKPTGVIILVFMIGFGIIAFLISRNRMILTRRFWKGIVYGFSVFSLWWGSALILYFTVGGAIGEAALSGVGYWFNFLGVFGKYVPPWYSPPWYTVGGWTYYPYHLNFMMGFLPFLFSFVGVGLRIRKKKTHDVLLVLFALSIYVLQSMASNKNPRYIMPSLPILYIYSAIGLIFVCTKIAGHVSSKLTKKNVARMISASCLITAVLIVGVMPLQSAMQIGYTPGMGFGSYLPFQQSLQIVKDTGEQGLIMPDSQENLFNTPTLTFYIASMDLNRKYGCCWSLSNPEEIQTFRIGEKSIKYVLVYNLSSSVSRYIQLHSEYFVLIDKAENSYGTIFVYKVKT